MNKFVLLLFILVLAIGLPLIIKLKDGSSNMIIDGFSNFNLDATFNNTSNAESDLLVKDTYPPTGRLGISNYDSNNTWWYKPVFKLGSYKQITNNIKYPKNPDIGSCTPISMCGALYHDKQNKSNYVKILPPLDPNCGRRVGYFDTGNNLLPFKTDMQNILY
jgi:hypothetical protein